MLFALTLTLDRMGFCLVDSRMQVNELKSELTESRRMQELQVT
jgi:hypothetical protein